MSFRLDYQEPISQVVERLRGEHTELHAKLERIVMESKTGDLPVAISLLNLIKSQILRHAVEEEARLVRAIMQESAAESDQSVEIMQQHRRIEEFLQDKLPHLADLPSRQAKREIEEFVNELKKHHSEEEAVAFPLALKSVALHKSRGKKRPKLRRGSKVPQQEAMDRTVDTAIQSSAPHSHAPSERS